MGGKLINQIAYILQRSTSQPHLKFLPLSSMLPQTQSENLQLQNTPKWPVPALRVEHSAPTSPSREQPSTHPRLDPHQNPWIKKNTKYLKTPQIPKSRNTQAAPRQVQHRLRRSLWNFRQHFRTQAAQHLIANHLFNLQYALHIYNDKDKRETIDTLFMVGDSYTWWKAVGN